MPVNDSTRLKQITVNDDDQSLARPGGAASKASRSIAPDKGSRLVAMQNTLLKGLDPDVKKLAGGGSGRQFFTQSAGGDLSTGLRKSPPAFGKRITKEATSGTTPKKVYRILPKPKKGK